MKKTPMKKTARPKPNGILPSEQWLLDNGHEKLVRAMRKNPESFAHIEQDPNLPAKP